MSTANDKAGLQEAGWLALVDERDRIARQSQSIREAIQAMRDVREQMQDRLIAILVELQQTDALRPGTNNGDAE